MSDLAFPAMLRAIRRHLPGIAYAYLLAREDDGWRAIDRRIFESADPNPPVPDDAVLDFAAGAARPTYLPQGDEGSDFCLLDARSILYFPLDEGRLLLYLAGTSTEAFARKDMEAAWAALTGPPAS